MVFDIEKFSFSIIQDNRELFDFNTMSSGYSAVFDIINDLIMRTENQKDSLTEGIVLIDEIETHLHLELQKIILPFLTELFPNIQFIISTHSPFILNSTENAVIFDLETGKLVQDGLAGFPYDGIVESYFDTDKLSNDMREKLDPHHNRTTTARVFDWDNLFYSCPHCNSVKNNRKYDDKILDCCKEDPELVLRHIYSLDAVKVQPIADDADEKVKMTAELIQNCFNQRNTGIRTVQSQERVDRLARTMNNLYLTLERYGLLSCILIIIYMRKV